MNTVPFVVEGLPVGVVKRPVRAWGFLSDPDRPGMMRVEFFDIPAGTRAVIRLARRGYAKSPDGPVPSYAVLLLAELEPDVEPGVFRTCHVNEPGEIEDWFEGDLDQYPINHNPSPAWIVMRHGEE